MKFWNDNNLGYNCAELEKNYLNRPFDLIFNTLKKVFHTFYLFNKKKKSDLLYACSWHVLLDRPKYVR